MFCLAIACSSIPANADAAHHPLRLYPFAGRISAQEVQNTTGNAFALQVGLSPRLRLEGVPVGLKLLLEYGALRDDQHHVFSTPSAQLLLDWAAAPRLELAIGAGAQFWVAKTGPVTRPVVTLEAHYVPSVMLWRFGWSGFVASSIGASAGAGLQVRAGIELDWKGRKPSVQQVALTQAAAPSELACAGQGPAVCPETICPVCSAPLPVAAPSALKPLGHGYNMVFAFNASTLNPQSKAYLNVLGQALARNVNAFTELAIIGHASAKGTEAHNLTVSLRRAHQVAKALMQAGVPEAKLTVHGVGETQPLPQYDPDDPAQQCVLLQLVATGAQGELQNLIDLPVQPTEDTRP